MSDKREDQFVDELLDAALSRYAASEPRPGLEERLLAELRARPAPPPAWGWPAAAGWQAAAVAAVVVALVAGLFYFTRQPAPEPVPVARAPAAPAVAPAPESGAPVAPIPEGPPAAKRTAAARVERVATSPRREQFPSAAPLSEQERLLLRYAQQAPPEQLVAARLGDGKLAALRIEPVRIPPLTSEPN